MKKIILFSMLLISVNSFAQQNGLKESFQASAVKLENQERQSLQDFVENIYINAVNTFNGKQSLVKKGKYRVALIDKDGKRKAINSSQLSDYFVDDLKSFKFEKSKTSDVLYGSNGELFGIITIEL